MRKFNTVDEWLDWQQTVHPLNIDFKLERILSVYKKLNISKIANKIINGKGRLLVRKSGTEPKIRIMVESNNKKLNKKCINIIKRTIK